MNRGSEWRKWDLHVHSPESFENSYEFTDKDEKDIFENIWNKYIHELENVPEISAIGITDYFSIEGYKKTLDYVENGYLENIDLILPNIEFRIDKFFNDDKRLNYHVILSNELDIYDIENKFLERLHFKDSMGEDIPLNKVNIEQMGAKLKREHSNFRKFSDYFAGCMNITVDLEEIINILKKDTFAGKYMLIAANDIDNLSWDGQGHLTRKNILSRSNAMFSSNENSRNFLLGKFHETEEEFKDEFGSFKPCIHGSDSHSFDNFCEPDLGRYCWIKADCTFEGLKQILFEPEDRVIIQKEKPEIRKNIYSLNAIEITDSNIHEYLSLNEGLIELNSNLVVVTGGKGSGKTALLDLIATCYKDRRKREGEDKNSFIQRIEEYDTDLNIKIQFLGNAIDDFEKKIYEDNVFDHSKITYLPQGNIEQYSGDRKKLDEEIKEIIFNNKDVIEGGYEEEFDNLETEIRDIYKKIDSECHEINDLRNETSDELLIQIKTEISIKKGELTNKEDEISEISETMDDDINEKISTLKDEETELNNNKISLLDVKNDLDEFRSSLINFKSENEHPIESLNENLKEIGIKTDIPELKFDLQINIVDDVILIINHKLETISSTIETKKDELKKLSGVEESYLELVEEKELIKSKLEFLNSQIAEIDDKKEKINNLENEILDEYKNLLSKRFEQKEHYEEIIKTFSEDSDDILNNINFKSYIYFDKELFLKMGLKLFDGRKNRTITEDIGALISKLDDLLKKEDMLGIENLIKTIFSMEEFLKESKNIHDLLKWIFNDYFSLSTEIFFKGRHMDKLSMGQKGTVLLKLFLAEGDYPLIIDQPEDNLDNKFIYKELVGAFRDAKKKRQIIIATNNANLVVNTDAEQIIVAEFKDNQIFYKPGSLEDVETRDNIMPILEGGEIAFREREKKYGI